LRALERCARQCGASLDQIDRAVTIKIAVPMSLRLLQDQSAECLELDSLSPGESNQPGAEQFVGTGMGMNGQKPTGKHADTGSG
jgi:hypothetical protein